MSTSTVLPPTLKMSQASSGLTQRELAEAAGVTLTTPAPQRKDCRPTDRQANDSAVLSNLVFWQGK